VTQTTLPERSAMIGGGMSGVTFAAVRGSRRTAVFPAVP
jgi:hypothetical protein